MNARRFSSARRRCCASGPRKRPISISLESGLSKQDSRYEIGRVADVLKFSVDRNVARRRPELLLRSHAARQDAARVHATRAAGRRHRRDHAVQSSDEPGRAQDRAGHRDEQSRHPEAVGEGAFIGLLSRRRALRSRPARADAASPDRRPARDRRGTRHAPSRRTRDLYRRRRDRQGDRGEGGLSASGARTRRQRSADRARRRRRGTRRHARGARLVQELRPALHGRQAHAGAEGHCGALYRTRRRKDARVDLRRSLRWRRIRWAP